MQTYAGMFSPDPERVIFDFHAACNDEGECIVTEERLVDAANVITALNDTVQHQNEALNQRLQGIAACEYAGIKKDSAIRHMEQASYKQDVTSTIKQLVTFAGCGLLLYSQ